MKRQIIFLILVSLIFTSCVKTKVQQGNLLPQSRIERLQAGMTKAEVANIMGTSLLITPFTDDRWDYAYTVRVNDGPITKKHLVLYFEEGVLVRKEAS